MKNLAQIRAAQALAAAPNIEPGQKGGDSISGFPAMIRVNGLMAALAYSVESNSKGEPKHKGALSIAKAIARHLQDLGFVDHSVPLELVKELGDCEDAKFRRATAESIAYLAYLKRFVA